MIARLIDIQLSFQIVADDGKHLRRVKVNPIMLPADRIDALPQAVRDVVVQVQQQLDSQVEVKPHPHTADDVPLNVQNGDKNE